ncbi:hypothetical protein V1511DRAFT_507560 [Dipodascopsis uninucleata]
MTRAIKSLVPGVYVPTLTFFDQKSEAIDLDTIALHTTRLARAGVSGIVALGSNGEACNLNDTERVDVIKTTREALDSAGFTDMPIIAGVTQQSVACAVADCAAAYHAGADAVLMLAPTYYRGAVTNELVEKFFTAVAGMSPIPLILYNYPGVVAGYDMDSDLMIRLAAHPNITGVKFTCGNTGKLARVVEATNAWGPFRREPDDRPSSTDFLAIAGMADFVVTAASLGAFGVISGAANLIPKTIVQAWSQSMSADASVRAKAWKSQLSLAQSDWVLTKIGLWGAKATLQKYFGYGGYMRLPGKRLTENELNLLANDVANVLSYEQLL